MQAVPRAAEPQHSSDTQTGHQEPALGTGCPSGTRESRAWPSCACWDTILVCSSPGSLHAELLGSSSGFSLELKLEGEQSNLPKGLPLMSQARGYCRFTYLCTRKQPRWAPEICQELKFEKK